MASQGTSTGCPPQPASTHCCLWKCLTPTVRGTGKSLEKCRITWLLGKPLLNSHLFPVCLPGNVSFPLLLYGETGRNCCSCDLTEEAEGFLLPHSYLGELSPTHTLISACSHGHAGKRLGNIKITHDILSRRNDCFALSVCVSMLSDGFFNILCPWSEGEHGLGSAAGFHLVHMESRKRNVSTKAPLCDTLPYIITAFSFSKTLLPPVNTRSLSLRQIVPQSLGGLAELRGKLQLLPESTLGFYKPAYLEEA